MRTTVEISQELNKLLKARQADKKLNAPNPEYKTTDLFGAGAFPVNKAKVSICYVSYHGSTKVDREVANGYLDWLLEDDRWKTGTHFPRIYAYQEMKRLYKDDNVFMIAEKGHRPQFVDQDKMVYVQLSNAYYDLLEVVAPKVNKQMKDRDTNMVPTVGGSFYPSGSFPTYHALEPAAQEAANQLFDKILTAVRAAYARGIDHGRSALAQLARGEITVGEFEKKVPTEVKRDFRGRIIEEE